MQPLRLHPFSLAFTGEWGLLEKQFRADDFRNALPRIRVSTILLAVIFALFAVLDHSIDPESAGEFLLIRFGIVIPAALVFCLLSWTKRFERVYQALAALIMVLGAFAVMYMMVFGSQAVRSSHQTGLLLAIVALFLFLGLRFIWAFAGWVPMLAGFILVNHFHSSSPEVLRAVSTFLFLSISIVCIEVSRRLEIGRRRNFALQWSLSLEKAMVAASNSNLETRIGERTRELLHANQVLRDEMSRTERLSLDKSMLEARLYHSERMEAVSRLAGGIASDFNELLTSIIASASQAAGEPAGSPVIGRALDVVVTRGEEAARLARKLLAFSRKQIVEPTPVDLNKALTALEGTILRLLDTGVALVWELSEGTGKVMVDPGQLEQVVINLVTNANSAVKPGGTIVIGTRVPSGRPVASEASADPAEACFCEFFVRDDGCGMDQSTLSRIFEPFFTTGKAGESAGLGLSTVYGIVHQHMGDIKVTSAPGEGSEFSVLLPKAMRDLDPDEQGRIRDANPHGTEVVLLVENDEAVRTVAGKTLESLGYRVLSATDARQAIELSERFLGTVHLLLTDVVMPFMGGSALAERLRETRPGMKVLYMSGYSGEIVSKQGVLESAAHFMKKPFSTTELAGRIREVLEGE